MQARKLGWTNLEVSPLGLGCWAIGGPTRFRGNQFGWGQIDEGEALRAIHIALDAGITFFDTADIYGTGHSERIIPIPGFKTVAQVQENAGALRYGPLSPQQMHAIAGVVTTSLTDEEAQSF